MLVFQQGVVENLIIRKKKKRCQSAASRVKTKEAKIFCKLMLDLVPQGGSKLWTLAGVRIKTTQHRFLELITTQQLCSCQSLLILDDLKKSISLGKATASSRSLPHYAAYIPSVELGSVKGNKACLQPSHRIMGNG